MMSTTKPTLAMLIEKCKTFCYDHATENLEAFKPIFESLVFEEWRDYVCFNAYKYCRKVLHVEEAFELVIIGWSPSQKTDVHDHPANGCLVKVLHGELTEIRSSIEGESQAFCHEAGQAVYMCNAYGRHEMENRSKSKTVSLHLYSPGTSPE